MSANDVFTIEVPWLNTLAESPVEIKEADIPLLKLMQHIIDSLQEKLASKTGAADEELQQRYAAVVASRQEYIEKLERANQATETMRGFRNRAEANEKEALEKVSYWRGKFEALESTNKSLARDLNQARQEVDGIPKLVENKVALELSRIAENSASSEELQEAQDALDLSEVQVAQLKEKNTKLAENNSQLNQRASEADNKATLLEELVSIQTETISNQLSAVINADKNYRNLQCHIDELTSYCSIIAHENVQMSGDNLYLEQIRELHNMKQVWMSEDGHWQSFFVAKSHLADLPEGAPEPDRNFGILFLINTDRGVGHTVYLDKDASIVFPEQVSKECLLPEEYHESFKAGVKALPVPEMEAAIKRAVERSRQILKVATLLDPDWNATLGLAEITERLSEYIPQHEHMRRLGCIDKTRDLAPKSVNLMNRINKRFGCKYSLKSEHGKLLGVSAGQAPRKAPKKSSRKRNKRG
ncbi:hypothetical protein [Vibrio campbellii]|uniref:hypothetical protein n=1 Tax=Vibrio campbellii TaxID=680 RepID=UPI00210CD12D|nr:hypothetical protein [Vibrio campbellii]UTZ44520.1 hypothetical protein HB764_24995 [Vibrio campbellii]